MKMKVTVQVQQEIDVAGIEIDLPAEEIEDPDNNTGQPFPPQFKMGDDYSFTIDAATGKIRNWPTGLVCDVHTKPRDSGTYTLIGRDGGRITSINQDYVPKCLDFDGEGYGDYVVLKVGADGTVAGFSKAFTPERVKDSFFATPDDD